MNFRFAHLKRLLFLAGVAAAISCVHAQSMIKPGQSIIFSSPDNDDAASNAPSLAAPPTVASGLPDAMQPPVFNFGAPPTGNARLPAPQAAATSSGDIQRLQKLIDDRKNWALLTPAEVLGIPTPEKILGIPERDAAGQKKNLTAVGRYYERQNQSQSGSTNSYQNDPTSRENLPDDQNDGRLNANIFNPANGVFGNPAQTANTFFNDGAPDNSAAAGQKADEGWGDFFAAPTRPTPAATAANLEQQAEMERFRQLLDPQQPPATAAKPSSGGSAFSSAQTASDSFFGQTLANPIGGSFTPLGSGIGGLPVSPSSYSQNNAQPATITPSWAPQPAPWLSSTPQPGVIPQRKF